MIEKLRIKCDYEWNGCPEVCPLESLSTHLKTCQYRLCLTCDLTVGPTSDDHNCIEGLKRNRNEWQIRSNSLKQRVKTLKTKLKESEEKAINFETKFKEKDILHKILKERANELEINAKDFERKSIASDVKLKESEEKSLNLETKCRQIENSHKELLNKYKALKTSTKSAKNDSEVFRHKLIANCVQFGKCSVSVGSIEFTEYGISLHHVSNGTLTEKPNVVILNYEIQCLYACIDPSLPMLCIKPYKGCPPYVDHKSDLFGFGFDVNSKDPSEQFIIIELDETIDETFVNPLVADVGTGATVGVVDDSAADGTGDGVAVVVVGSTQPKRSPIRPDFN
ncbi:unnamed protein product, partial [Medioppia subpectinata]